MSYFRKKPNTVDALKENRAVAKILSDNPALAKSLQNKPELSKSFQEVQKNPALMNRIKSFEKNSVATSRLKNVLGENPRGLTEKSVTKLGAVVNKSPRKYDDEEGVLFACGLMMLLILGGGITIAVLAPEKF
ncbi:hypothetical protein PHMEG_000463 [Phytophthora megakarya]|uniref:Uncharacterized protein n=1 Tax=Phytophthora megakarya TaxID=4795 RepID=A0A225X555_9STRA|nr:hypothetical protein PHMEG_000463 [Phytophthora megakarya]